MTTCEVVVIGGGCVGASVAYHLAEAGCTDVVLLEASTLAGGSTGKAAGGIRVQHGDPLNTQLALRSLGEFRQFEQLTDAEIFFRQVGYLFLLDSLVDLELFRAAAARQVLLGIPVQLLSAGQALDLVPQLAVDGLVGASFCAIDGYATPEAVVQGYAAAARRRGVQVRQHAAVRRVVVRGGRACGVELADEQIAARAVVCAAGVGSRFVGGTAGVDLPVTPQRRRMFFTRDSGGIGADAPLTVDFSTGFYFHREGPGLVFAGREFEPENLMAPATRRLPLLGGLAIASSWHGDYDMSPDHNGMVGQAEAARGFYYATGFSGHGFMLSPAIGEHLAELIVGRETTIDLSALRAERFAWVDGRRPEPIVI